jgi:hypothetical protein
VEIYVIERANSLWLNLLSPITIGCFWSLTGVELRKSIEEQEGDSAGLFVNRASFRIEATKNSRSVWISSRTHDDSDRILAGWRGCCRSADLGLC